MPYAFNPVNPSFTPSQPLPLHLDHKPVYAMPYEPFDGVHATGTDIRYISVGLAQYDPYQVSIKTMRYTGQKWTRQAEELPIHRPVDMALFLAKVMFDSQHGAVTIPTGTLQGQTSTIEIQRESRSAGELASYHQFLSQHDGLLKARFNALRDVLNDLKTRGLI